MYYINCKVSKNVSVSERNVLFTSMVCCRENATMYIVYVTFVDIFGASNQAVSSAGVDSTDLH